MFENVTPESVGIKSAYVEETIKRLNNAGLVTHDLLLMRGNKIFGEFYWKPFNKDFRHRQYSQTKSFVGIAIGLLEEEGKLKLTDKIYKYFPEKIDGKLPKYLKEQTIKDMLTMETSCYTDYWFTSSDQDRTHLYLNTKDVYRPAGTIFRYDSPGSQVLSALVEKLTQMPILDYLKLKLFNYMGTFQTAEILKTRNGDSWGDSALVCTPRDMLSMGRLLLNKGRWQGKQLINKDYVIKATSKQVDNNQTGFDGYSSYGYGYQIWMHRYGFSFNGMGCQFTYCVPKYDVVMVINSDNQGYESSSSLIYEILFSGIIDRMSKKPLKENESAYRKLLNYADTLELYSLSGSNYSKFSETLKGKTFVSDDEKAVFKKFSFDFSGDEGELHYTNAQGDKVLKFGLGKNVFTKFPQLGYSNDIGGQRTTDGFMYDCAVSGAWRENKKIMIKVQVIDRYFGNCSMVFSFKGKEVAVSVISTAEDFLKEYYGDFVAREV